MIVIGFNTYCLSVNIKTIRIIYSYYHSPPHLIWGPLQYNTFIPLPHPKQ